MVDITIDAALQTAFSAQWVGHQKIGPFWTSDQIGYVIEIGANTDVYYRKTTDAGATWSGTTSVEAVTASQVAAWADWETSGDTGTLIHIVYQNAANNTTRYRALNTSGDTFVAAATTILTQTNVDETAIEYINKQISITKARGGNLYVHAIASGEADFVRSTDGGVNWTARASPMEADTEDQVQLFPSGDTDTNDIACLYMDESVNTLSFKLYDDSANSWGTETTITTGLTPADWPDDYHGRDVAVRHSDNKAICVVWTDRDTAQADLLAFVLTLTVAGANSTALTNVLTNSNESGECALMIDNNTDDIYCAYLRGGTWGTTVTVYYKKSTDDGSTWGTETTLSDTAGLYKDVYSQHGVKNGGSGRFEPAWINETNDDLLSNTANSVAITAGAGVSGAAAGRAGARAQDAGTAARLSANAARAGTRAQAAATTARSTTGTSQAGARAQCVGVKSVTSANAVRAGAQAQDVAIKAATAAAASSAGAQGAMVGAQGGSKTAFSQAGARAATTGVHAHSTATTARAGAQAASAGAHAVSAPSTSRAGLRAATAGTAATGVQGAAVGRVGARAQCVGVRAVSASAQGSAGARAAVVIIKRGTASAAGQAGCTTLTVGVAARTAAATSRAGARAAVVSGVPITELPGTVRSGAQRLGGVGAGLQLVGSVRGGPSQS